MPTLTPFPLCCGADIINNFASGRDPSGVQNPQEPSGFKLDDTGMGYARDKDGKQIPIAFADKFKQDFETKRKQAPNRMYCCILNQKQYDAHGKGWPKLLKEMGFEFVRRWSNSVHDGSYNYYPSDAGREKEALKDHTLYLFVLCTDDKGKCKDFTRPPEGWEELLTEPPSLVQKAKNVMSAALKAA